MFYGVFCSFVESRTEDDKIWTSLGVKGICRDYAEMAYWMFTSFANVCIRMEMQKIEYVAYIKYEIVTNSYRTAK